MDPCDIPSLPKDQTNHKSKAKIKLPCGGPCTKAVEPDGGLVDL